MEFANSKIVAVMINRCGCLDAQISPIEYELPPFSPSDSISNSFNREIDYSRHKQEAICKFNAILTLLECGILPDLEPLLEEIFIIWNA